MSVLSFTALALLVLIATGFYLGRFRILSRFPGPRSALHSLPNYYGYYVALWTGLPALLLLITAGLLSRPVIEQFTIQSIQSDGRGLVVEFEDRIAQDPAYQDLLHDLAEAQVEVDVLTAELDRLRQNLSASIDSGALDAVEADQVSAINRLADLDDDARDARQIVFDAMYDEAVANGTNPLALAGFRFSLAPREQQTLFMSDVYQLSIGRTASGITPERSEVSALMEGYRTWATWAVAIAAMLLSALGLLRSNNQVQPAFRARTHVERLVVAVLLLSSGIAILTTIGIVLSLLFESLRFFNEVPVLDFLFGLQWSPQVAIRSDQVGQSGAFGAVPLFAGTALITFIAMIIAVPIGLLSAIYLSEYAGPRFRAIFKPLLEVLAGIPTVVYGFFALLTVGPAIRGLFNALGFEDVVTQSALSAGLVMGVMIIPFISSLSDDVINAVPQSLRDGSYAMGATRSETVSKVILPAALPGIMGAVLLAVSRAVGETMIVVMAAGQGANLTFNPLEAVTTITVQIHTLLTGDLEFEGAKTLSAFALGLVLFVVTLIMNVIALRVVQKYREKYD